MWPGGVPAISVAGIATDRRLPVTATPDADFGWSHFRIEVSDEPVEEIRALGDIGVDWARFVFADAAALRHWQHEDSVDGRADVVFWGLHEGEVAEEFGVGRTSTPGEDVYGWLDLPEAEALERAQALQDRKSAAPERRFAFDFRPHSHHWQVMAGVRASEYEAATIEVGGAEIMFAMTSVGDGFFPARLELGRSGAPVAIQVTVQGTDE